MAIPMANDRLRGSSFVDDDRSGERVLKHTKYELSGSDAQLETGR